MADEPQAPISTSRLAAENAYRKRQGLPPLTMDEYAAQLSGAAPATTSTPVGSQTKAGLPPTSPTPPQAPQTSAVPNPTNAAPAAPAAASATSAPVQKLSPSKFASENAYRKKMGMPLLTPEEAGLVPAGEAPVAPAAAAPGAPGAKAPAAPAAPRPAAAATQPPPSAAATVARGVDANRYVGTPAVGTSKAAAAGGLASTGPHNTELDRTRRRLVWSAIVAFLAAWLLAFFRFFLPRTLFEPSTVFKVGYPSDYAIGVDTKWQAQYRIWVDRTPDRLFVIYARCTHLGCTPDWKPAENKFKCPCHGSGYDSEGVNFEGPAPRPMDRAHVELDPTGQIVVDTSRLFQWPKGVPYETSDFNKQNAFLSV
ncbi:MAG: Rieske 2Fe-2S domain-containing protein [Acidobacteriota bacterium]|nr:Rieske 2Fe-2S domain-containing protein [Acidobacteriota bacterium]